MKNDKDVACPRYCEDCNNYNLCNKKLTQAATSCTMFVPALPAEEKMKKSTNPKDALSIKKIPIHLVPIQVLSEIGLAMLEGGRKYGGHNYRDAGVRASVYLDAVWRHLFLQFWEGEDIDPDSKLHHVTKAIASLVVLRDSMLMDNWIDDRPIRHPNGPDTQRLNALATKIIEEYPDCVDPFTEKKAKTDYALVTCNEFENCGVNRCLHAKPHEATTSCDTSCIGRINSCKNSCEKVKED